LSYRELKKRGRNLSQNGGGSPEPEKKKSKNEYERRRDNLLLLLYRVRTAVLLQKRGSTYRFERGGAVTVSIPSGRGIKGN